MEEKEEYGLPDVDYKPIDRGSQGNPKSSTHQSRNKNKKGDSKAPLLITLGIIVVVVAVAAWFFLIAPGIERSKQEKAIAEEQARQEAAEAEAQAQREEEERLAAEAEAEQLAAEEEAASAEPEVGTVTVLSEKTGRSYVVIGSFFDGDLAMDEGNKLASEGVSTFILEPVGDVKFYRLAVADFDSYGEANSSIDQYRSTYGEEIWALRY
jgi:cell division septation protein DedD